MKTKIIVSIVLATVMASITANADVKVSTKGGGLKVSSGESTIQIGGRLMYDYNRSEKNGAVDEDQFEERRARLYFKGDINKKWGYKLNFNVDGSGFEDLYVQYKGFGNAAHVTVGNQRQPFGLQDQTSSNDISILERTALAELFAPGRAEGVQLSGDLGHSVYYGVGVFFDDVDDAQQGEELGFSGRVTWAPVKTDRRLIHLGLAYFDNNHNSDAFGLEVAAVSGPFHVQAEFDDGTINGNDVNGYYVQAGYIVTGETRPYKSGKFKRVKPDSNSGAWEVLARYEDGDGNFGDIELGNTDATSYTLGVNYYANKHVRIGVNYTEGDGNISDDSGREFRVRLALAF